MANGNISEGVNCQFQMYPQCEGGRTGKGQGNHHLGAIDVDALIAIVGNVLFRPIPIFRTKGRNMERGKWKRNRGNGGSTALRCTNVHGGTEYAYVGQQLYANYTDHGMGVRRNDSTTPTNQCHGFYAIPEKEHGVEHFPSTDSRGKYYSDPINQRAYILSDTDDHQAPHRKKLQIETDEWHIPIWMDRGASRTVVGETWMSRRHPHFAQPIFLAEATSVFGAVPNLPSQ